MTFKDFNFKPLLEKAVFQAGFREPSPIQALAIPPILAGKDVVGQAHTGTGKTAAFSLPILHNFKKSTEVQVVILVPTRELAIQVADEVYKFSRLLDIHTATVYGGTGYRRQIEHIKNAGVVVATPGRLLDLLQSKKITLNPQCAVLDEADEMLNMGFLEDVRRIFSYFGNRSQTLMFSATMPQEIKDLATTLMSDPVFLRVEQEEKLISETIAQYFYVIDEHERDEAITRLIDFANPKKGIIFCRTKRETERLAQFLKGQGYKAESLHGDMEQRDRREVMRKFKQNQYEILVATDVAARGLDIRDVSHVFNYHIPLDPESYVHRIGRTGRAKKEGTAMMLVTPHEIRDLKRIQADIGQELKYHAIPELQGNQKKALETFVRRVRQESVSSEYESLLKEIQGKESVQTIALKLLSLLYKDMTCRVSIGKTEEEICQLLTVEGGVATEKPRGGHYRKNNRSRDRVERGTRRGQVPEPTLSDLGGGSRIVARKLY